MLKTRDLVLSNRQRIILQEFAQQTEKSPRLAQRAQIIIATERGLSISKIAQRLKISHSIISHCRRRWRKMTPELNSAELDGDIENLRDTIENTLMKLTTKREPSTVTDEQLTQIVAISREDPKDSGHGFEFWTMATLADEAMKRGIVEQISVNRLSYLLRKIGFRNEAPPPPLHRRTNRLQESLADNKEETGLEDSAY